MRYFSLIFLALSLTSASTTSTVVQRVSWPAELRQDTKGLSLSGRPYHQAVLMTDDRQKRIIFNKKAKARGQKTRAKLTVLLYP